MTDLAIAYRIYPRVAKPAEGLPFSEDKLEFSEICLRSFKESLGNLRVKIWALLDGCPHEYETMFRKYFDAQELVLVPLGGIGNRATFAKQIEILLGQSESDFVYFAEDDYFYLPNQFPLILDVLRAHEDMDFLSPYDHPDCYNLKIHEHPKWIRVHNNRHWRTAASTCLTFLARKQSLLQNKNVFLSYSRNNDDCSLWLTLTKHSLFNPFQLMRFTRQQPLFAKIMIKAWYHGWNQILFGERIKLWVPIPGIATHLNAQALSPTIDWVTLIREQQQKIVRDSKSALIELRTGSVGIH